MPCIARAGRKMEGGPTGHTATWGESGGGGGVRAAIVGHRWSAAGRSGGGGRRSGEQGIGTGGPIGEKVAHAPAREKRKWAQGREKGVGPAQERITIFLFLFKFQKKSTCFDSKADFLSSKNFK
jgi:hypothetical protein